MPSHSAERRCWEVSADAGAQQDQKMSPASSRSWVRAWSPCSNCSMEKHMSGLQKSMTEPKSYFLRQVFIKETAETTSCWMPSSTSPPFPKNSQGLCSLFAVQHLPQTFFLTWWRWRKRDLQSQEAFEESLQPSSEQPGCVNAEKNVSICLPVSENGKNGKELFKGFQEVINKNNEMGFHRERLNIKGNFLIVGASSGSWWFLKEKWWMSYPWRCEMEKPLGKAHQAGLGWLSTSPKPFLQTVILP